MEAAFSFQSVLDFKDRKYQGLSGEAAEGRKLPSSWGDSFPLPLLNFWQFCMRTALWSCATLISVAVPRSLVSSSLQLAGITRMCAFPRFKAFQQTSERIMFMNGDWHLSNLLPRKILLNSSLVSPMDNCQCSNVVERFLFFFFNKILDAKNVTNASWRYLTELCEFICIFHTMWHDFWSHLLELLLGAGRVHGDCQIPCRGVSLL